MEVWEHRHLGEPVPLLALATTLVNGAAVYPVLHHEARQRLHGRPPGRLECPFVWGVASLPPTWHLTGKLSLSRCLPTGVMLGVHKCPFWSIFGRFGRTIDGDSWFTW